MKSLRVRRLLGVCGILGSRFECLELRRNRLSSNWVSIAFALGPHFGGPWTLEGCLGETRFLGICFA